MISLHCLNSNQSNQTNVNQYSKEINENHEIDAVKPNLEGINRNSVPNIKLQMDKFSHEASQQQLFVNRPTTFENYATCKRKMLHRRDSVKLPTTPMLNNFCKVHSFLSTPDLSIANGRDITNMNNKNKSARLDVVQKNSPDLILANENVSEKYRFQKNQPFHCLHHHQHTQNSFATFRRKSENPLNAFKTKMYGQSTGSEIGSFAINNEYTINKFQTDSIENVKNFDRDVNCKSQSTISTRF